MTIKDADTPLRSITLGNALDETWDVVTKVINNAPLMNVHDTVNSTLPTPYTATLTERQWRLIRFALAQAKGTI